MANYKLITKRVFIALLACSLQSTTTFAVGGLSSISGIVENPGGTATNAAKEELSNLKKPESFLPHIGEISPNAAGVVPINDKDINKAISAAAMGPSKGASSSGKPEGPESEQMYGGGANLFKRQQGACNHPQVCTTSTYDLFEKPSSIQRPSDLYTSTNAKALDTDYFTNRSSDLRRVSGVSQDLSRRESELNRILQRLPEGSKQYSMAKAELDRLNGAKSLTSGINPNLEMLNSLENKARATGSLNSRTLGKVAGGVTGSNLGSLAARYTQPSGKFSGVLPSVLSSAAVTAAAGAIFGGKIDPSSVGIAAALGGIGSAVLGAIRGSGNKSGAGSLDLRHTKQQEQCDKELSDALQGPGYKLTINDVSNHMKTLEGQLQLCRDAKEAMNMLGCASFCKNRSAQARH